MAKAAQPAAGEVAKVAPAAKPPQVKVEFVWIWLSTGENDKLHDPAAIPATAEAHEAWVADSQWGPHSARLCPVRILELRGDGVSVMDRLTGNRRDVPRSQLLPWYEGLLVLDALMRSNIKVSWTTALQPILEQERAKYKEGILRSSIYVERQLLTTAVTGPKFTDSRGKKYSYRRQPLLKDDPPADGEAEDGWYKVNDFDSFIPPWEAFLQPKCGLYQDFYNVLWGAPHNKTDYTNTESGGEMPGSTWEPDECLPEELDKLRTLAKTRWVLNQKAKEQKQAEEFRVQEKRKREVEQEQAEREKRRKMAKYNPKDLKLIEDMCNSNMGHGWEVLPSNADENEIKRGWPKSEKEYPTGHKPVCPPGPCSEKCDCMEDWHMGQKSTSRSWLADINRDRDAQAALDAFVAQEPAQVRRRGTVTNMHYLESIATASGHTRTPGKEEISTIEFVKLVWNIVGESAQAIPFSSFLQPDAESQGIVAAYATIFATCGPSTYIPVRFMLKDPPDGIAIDSNTGRLRIDPEALSPEIWERTKPLGLTIALLDVSGETTLMGVVLHVDRTANGEVKEREQALVKEKQKSQTARTTRKIVQLACPTLQRTLRNLLKEVWDFEKSVALEKPAGRWARAMLAAATAARATYCAQVVSRP
eukprot:TRINITY_DN76298_c0_g1_i1.p1 TRINITY_DN76298_c0_g1~~TRINITY_DN76298_c0_g1_i1.p1  ORF type:complete len:646 (-),score=139.40 TRINITY_DN76298_c0_g1_i1:88-2025(-)